MIVDPIKSIRVPYPPLYRNNVRRGWGPNTAACHQDISISLQRDSLATQNHKRWWERWKEGKINIFISTSIYGHMKDNMIFWEGIMEMKMLSETTESAEGKRKQGVQHLVVQKRGGLQTGRGPVCQSACCLQI